MILDIDCIVKSFKPTFRKFPTLSYPTLPYPTLPCSLLTYHILTLPCPALPCPALPCPALLCSARPLLALPCPALLCSALHCLYLPCPALLCSALLGLYLPFPVLSCPALLCLYLQDISGWALRVLFSTSRHATLLNSFLAPSTITTAQEVLFCTIPSKYFISSYFIYRHCLHKMNQLFIHAHTLMYIFMYTRRMEEKRSRGSCRDCAGPGSSSSGCAEQQD